MVERDEDGFLERWSQRKRGESASGAPETETAEATPGVDPPGLEDAPDSGDPEVVAKLPDLDSLTEDSDFTAFLQDGVPEALRRQALRRLWRLNPVFANLDGLNDYDEDYSLLGMVAENVKTIYKVGKGYLDEEEDKDKDKDKGKDEDETENEAEEMVEDGTEDGGGDESGDRDPESVAEAGPEGAPDSQAPVPSEPIEFAQVSQAAPASESGARSVGSREPKSERPAPGSALARRWGGSPDKV